MERFSPERISARGIFRADGIPKMIRRHIAGEADHGKALFAALAFDQWCDQVFGEGAAVEIGEMSGETNGPITAESTR